MPSRINGPRILCIIGHVRLLNAWPCRPAEGPRQGGRVACRYLTRAPPVVDEDRHERWPTTPRSGATLRTDPVPRPRRPDALRNRRTTPRPAARQTPACLVALDPATPALRFPEDLTQTPLASAVEAVSVVLAPRALLRCQRRIGRSEAMCGCDGSVTSSEVSVDHDVRSAGIAADLHTVIARVGAIGHDGVLCRARVQPRECRAWPTGPARVWPGSRATTARHARERATTPGGAW
jgi:hypothetical protein